MDGFDARWEGIGMRMTMESMLLLGMRAKRWRRGIWMGLSML